MAAPILTFAFSGLVAGLPLAAAAAPPVPAPAAPAATVPSIAVERYVLGNGLTVLLSPDHRLPLVATEVHYLVGSANEVKGRSGFAHLFEHLMFQGSQHFDEEYFKPFDPLGGTVNGTTDTDRTNFFEQVPSNALEVSLWMQSDRMENLLPAMTQAKLDNQRDVVKNERRQRYENTPYGEVWRLLQENLYPDGHPYHHTTIGSHEDLTAASMDDVKGFFQQYYVPANALLTISGDFDPAAVKVLVEKYFGTIAAGKRAERPQATMPVLGGSVGGVPIHVVEKDEVKLPRIYLAWPTPALFSPEDAALDVWATVLADGKSSRLYKPLVYEQKVAKDVSAFQASAALSSYFVVQVTAAPGKSVAELEAALLPALRTALSTPPTDDEMQRALSGWRKSFYQRVEGVLSRAQLLSSYQHFAGRPDFLQDDLSRYTSLTGAKVNTVATRWVPAERPTQYVRVDILPAPEAPPADKTPATPTKGAKAPVTKAPVTKAPATKAPVTKAPVTKEGAK